MKQYNIDPGYSAAPYAEWPVTAPTTRRLDVAIDPGVADQRLEFFADTHGDNGMRVVVTKDEQGRVRGSEPMRRRRQEWAANRPRYGTWAHYRADVELVRAVVELLAWTLTPAEEELLAELERYGGQDPARRRVAA
jgi:hypothetical protein